MVSSARIDVCEKTVVTHRNGGLMQRETSTRRTAETLLTGEGYRVITAGDGFEALAKIIEQRPAIIFLDVMMPRLDGYQTCSIIKRLV